MLSLNCLDLFQVYVIIALVSVLKTRRLLKDLSLFGFVQVGSKFFFFLLFVCSAHAAIHSDPLRYNKHAASDIILI